MDVSKEIKNCRKHLGLTQKKLGEISGLSQNTICSYETGRYTSITVVEQILNAMGYELAVVKRRQRP